MDTISINDIAKGHVRLRHGTATALANYIRAAGLCAPDMQETINTVIRDCECQGTFRPSPHAKVATRPPSSEPQTHIIIEVIKHGGKKYLHSVDECTNWSEAGCIHRKTMDVQIEDLRQIQYIRHGPPQSINCDREYHNSQFMQFCAKTNTALHLVAANDYEPNGLIENANRTLRSFYDRIRLGDKRTVSEFITAEAVLARTYQQDLKERRHSSCSMEDARDYFRISMKRSPHLFQL